MADHYASSFLGCFLRFQMQGTCVVGATVSRQLTAVRRTCTHQLLPPQALSPRVSMALRTGSLSCTPTDLMTANSACTKGV